MLLSVGDLFLSNRRRVSLCVYICVCMHVLAGAEPQCRAHLLRTPLALPYGWQIRLLLLLHKRESSQWKEKMSENEWKWACACMAEEGGEACARQREGREAEKSNSWRVRSGTCCPLGSADRSTPPPTTHTNVLNTPTRLNSYIHTRPGSNTDYVTTYISAKPYWSKMKKQMACWCDSTVWVSPLNLSDTLPSP